MAFYNNGNSYGLHLPITHFRDSYTYVCEQPWDQGEYNINETGYGFNVYSCSTGTRIGGIAHRESYVVVGHVDVGNGTIFTRARYIVFTGPDGYTPTLGLLDDLNYTQSFRWTQRQQLINGEYWFCTYNRSITFYGHSMPAGSQLKSNGRSLALYPSSYMTDAGNLSVQRAVSAAFPYYDCSGAEWCNAKATTRGVNCDVQGVF